MPAYGKRGGDSPNAGKKARTFRATAPTGLVVSLRKFKVTGDGPFVMALYLHEGSWHAASVFEVGQVPSWAAGGSHLLVPAHEVKPA